MSEILYPPRIKALNYNPTLDYKESTQTILNLTPNLILSFVGGVFHIPISINFKLNRGILIHG